MGAATAFGSGAAEVLTAGGATPLAITTLGLSATMIGDGSNIMLGEYKHSEGANVLASLGRPVNSYAWEGALAMGKTGLEIGTLSLLSRTLPAVDAAVTSGSKVLSKEVAIAGKGVQREAVILEKQVNQDISYTHNHVAGHNRAAAKMEAKQVKNVVKTGEESGNVTLNSPKKQVLSEEGTVLNLKHKPGSNLQHFEKKVSDLQNAAKEGVLKKTTEITRDSKLARDYRKKIMPKVEKQYGKQNPEFVQRIKDMLETRLDADHTIELQLGGKDVIDNLRLLDRSVNRSVGVQIKNQISPLKDGAIIKDVVIMK